MLPGEVCRGVSSSSGGGRSAACQPSEPESLPGGAAWREPGAWSEAAGCQVHNMHLKYLVGLRDIQRLGTEIRKHLHQLDETCTAVRKSSANTSVSMGHLKAMHMARALIGPTETRIVCE